MQCYLKRSKNLAGRGIILSVMKVGICEKNLGGAGLCAVGQASPPANLSAARDGRPTIDNRGRGFSLFSGSL
jgi:hypothetical protein